ncbi:hypothetical protein EGW08_017639 [Elysia chlorotica]|uniref:Uncharacterized protein n=1 Tax=Elysia chlorotica TaxID=188477 RepID=A0A433SZ91_ELYCH|nr:hypothetical protein EGW08_017639 [Elysia chlorotica]
MFEPGLAAYQTRSIHYLVPPPASADLTVDVAADDYIPGVSPDVAGVKVFLRTSSDMSALPPDQSVLVAAGESLQLTLRKAREVNRLEDDERCVSDITYSRTMCERQCLELHAARVCGCSLGLESPLGQRCRLSVQYECKMMCERQCLELHAARVCGCSLGLESPLGQRCRLSVQYELPIEIWPELENHREELVQMTAISHSWITDQSQISLKQTLDAAGIFRNFTDLSKTISKIRVRIARGAYEKLKEEREVTLLQLLINLGALSALTCGVSVLTAVEIVWIFGKILTVMCCAVMKKEEREDQVEFLPPPSMNRPTQLYNHPDTYRWVAYPGNVPSYPRHNQPDTGDMAPAIFMMPPPPRDYPGAGADHLYALSGPRNFYLRESDMRRNRGGVAGHGSEDSLSTRSEIRDGRDAGSHMVVDEVLDDSDLRQSPRVAVVAAPTALFSHPWERPGRNEPHRTVLNTSQPGDGPNGMPLFNVPVAPPLPGEGGDNRDDDLRLHGLDKLNDSNNSSGDDQGNMAPRSSSPLYRVEQSFGNKERGERNLKGKDTKEAKPAIISNGEITRHTDLAGTGMTGSARPDGPGVETQTDQNQHGQGAGRSKKTAWSEDSRQLPSQAGYGANRKNVSDSHKKGTANGHISQNAATQRPQFFPRTTPIQPNTWYVPEFQRMEFYDGRHPHIQRADGPGYFMYQGGVNGQF